MEDRLETEAFLAERPVESHERLNILGRREPSVSLVDKTFDDLSSIRVVWPTLRCIEEHRIVHRRVVEREFCPVDLNGRGLACELLLRFGEHLDEFIILHVVVGKRLVAGTLQYFGV